MNPFSKMRKPKEVNELVLAKQRERGDRARALINDELLSEAFVRVERVYMDAWRGSGCLDVELRERAHVAVNLLSDLKRQIVAFVAEGDAAVKKLEAELKKKN